MDEAIVSKEQREISSELSLLNEAIQSTDGALNILESVLAPICRGDDKGEDREKELVPKLVSIILIIYSNKKKVIDINNRIRDLIERQQI